MGNPRVFRFVTQSLMPCVTLQYKACEVKGTFNFLTKRGVDPPGTIVSQRFCSALMISSRVFAASQSVLSSSRVRTLLPGISTSANSSTAIR